MAISVHFLWNAAYLFIIIKKSKHIQQILSGSSSKFFCHIIPLLARLKLVWHSIWIYISTFVCLPVSDAVASSPSPDSSVCFSACQKGPFINKAYFVHTRYTCIRNSLKHSKFQSLPGDSVDVESHYPLTNQCGMRLHMDSVNEEWDVNWANAKW